MVAESLYFSCSNGTENVFNVDSLSMDALRYRSLFRKRISEVPGGLLD